MTVLVTGATGNVGREVMLALQARGVAVRAAKHLDFRDAATYTDAFEGVTAMFLLRPSPLADMKTTLIPFVDVARAKGVRHVVFLSVLGADTNRFVPHHAVEVHLAAGGRDWTLLRSGFFAQNLGDAYRRDIVEDDRIYVPAGRGRAAFVDVRDVAEIAAAVLVDPAAHQGNAYSLTGPDAVGFTEAATILTSAIGRPIRYQAASVAGYALHLRRRGMPATQIAVQALLHVGLRFGQAERVDPTLARLLGRSGRTLRDYVRDHATIWRRIKAS